MDTDELITNLLQNPEKLIKNKPYIRAVQDATPRLSAQDGVLTLNNTVRASIPRLKYEIIPVGQLLAELDPLSHKILYDENIPSITAKHANGGYVEIEYKKMAIPFQLRILDKQVLYLCTNHMQHIMLNTNPTTRQSLDFMRIKQAWDERNMEGRKTQMVRHAKSQGRAGLLFYFNYKGQITARNLSYEQGYQLCSHTDDNGDHILETIFYESDGVQYIDSYDDTYRYRYTNDTDNASSKDIIVDGWRWHKPVAHGFSEIPLVVKNSKVAWDKVQNIIEVYEVIANIFAVCQKRYGWGLLYVKGQFNPNAKKIAGNVVLNDTSLDENADAKFLTPPTPENQEKYLEQLKELIQLGSGTTFILPKDINLSSDVSGLAIQLTQELDIETANNDVISWQNVASKMMRLFKDGLAKELTRKDKNDTAIVDFANVNISTRFVVWRPQSEEAYNQMLATVHGAGGISTRTFIEKNTCSSPDELARIDRESQQEAQNTSSSQNTNDNDGNTAQRV